MLLNQDQDLLADLSIAICSSFFSGDDYEGSFPLLLPSELSLPRSVSSDKKFCSRQ